MKYLRSFTTWCLAISAGLGVVSTAFSAPVPLVNHGDTWRYHQGSTAPQADWKTTADGSLDGTWLSGAGGFGYGDGDDATVLNNMQNSYTTVYIRKEINIATMLDTNQHLFLVMDYDDGFVAWLDGVEVARGNVSGSGEPANTATAAGNHEASAGSGGNAPQTFDLGAIGDRLAVGTHVLALMGLNVDAPSSDMSLIADLSIQDAPVPPLLAHGDTWRYRKGSIANGAPQANWQTIAEGTLDGTWLSGAGGFGYGDGDDATVLNDMQNSYTTVSIRRDFNVGSAFATNLHVLLEVDYDDGFVAWLDGVEVARGNVPGSGEPPYNATASGNHEASGGGSGANPPTTYDLGAASTLLGVGNHTLALMGLNDQASSSDLSLIADLFVQVPPPPPPGTIAVDTIWTLANSPYVISNNITVNSGVTLTIEPGVEVLFNQGLGMTIDGRLLAEGDEVNRIRFARNAGAGSWGRIELNGGPESRFAYCDVDGSSADGNIRADNSSVYLNHVNFTNTTAQLVTLDDSSCTILNCHFPSIQGNELLHFNVMPPGGHALIASNIFGTPGIPATSGYNDIIDFTGGNRPGPIVEFINNIFLSSVDDVFDMDGTDAHIEGNIFMNVMQDAQRDSGSYPITTGAAGGNTSELVVCRNIFYNCEHTLLTKDYGSMLAQNNTILTVKTNTTARTGSGAQIPPGVVNFSEPWRGVPGGRGVIFEGNIVWDLESQLINFFTNSVMFFDVSQSLIQGTNWPGTGNISSDPMFADPSGITYLNIRSNLSLMAGSPAIGTGPNGLDMGALVPAGATISGEPTGTTTNTSATLTVAGPGIFAYKWRLNDGPWSGEVPLTTVLVFTADMFASAQPIVLSGLADGTYTVYVVGKNSAGTWQSTNNPTASQTWTVQNDIDHDGMPDDWEDANMLDKNDPNDAGMDDDNDGFTNLDEYVAGTDPQQSNSFLQISSSEFTGGVFVVRFTAAAGRTYTIEYRDSVSSGSWVKLVDVPAQGNTGEVTVTDSNPAAAHRFYRIVAPATP